MKDKTTISLDARKIEILLSWIYTDLKPDKEHEVDKVIVRQLKLACDRLECEDVFQEFANFDAKDYDEFGEKIDAKTKKLMEEQVYDISNPLGKFKCPKCKIRTDEKTYNTTCVICNTVLIRMGVSK